MVKNGMGMVSAKSGARGVMFPLGPRRVIHNRAVKRTANVRRRRYNDAVIADQLAAHAEALRMAQEEEDARQEAALIAQEAARLEAEWADPYPEGDCCRCPACRGVFDV